MKFFQPLLEGLRWFRSLLLRGGRFRNRVETLQQRLDRPLFRSRVNRPRPTDHRVHPLHSWNRAPSLLKDVEGLLVGEPLARQHAREVQEQQFRRRIPIHRHIDEQGNCLPEMSHVVTQVAACVE